MPTASSRPSAPAPQLIAGRYSVEATLGKGGVGEVFRVTDVSLGTQLALKRLSASASLELQALFEREYQTLARLNHPHTVEVYEYGRDSEGVFYTMELLAGSDMRQRATMPWREACSALRDAALATTGQTQSGPSITCSHSKSTASSALSSLCKPLHVSEHSTISFGSFASS